MKQFKIALVALAQEVCEMLHGKEMPMRTWTRIERLGNNQTSFPVERRPDISALMIEFYRKLDKILSFKQLSESIELNLKLKSAILSDAAGQPITDNSAKQMWILNSLVSPFLSEYFTKRNVVDFDRKTVNSIVAKFIRKIRTPITKFISISPLLNLEITMDVLDIAPGVRLRKLSNEQLEKWFNSDSVISSSPISNMDLINMQCAVEISNEAHQDKRQSRYFLNNLVDLLRLLTDLNIYVAFTEEEYQEESRPLLNQSSRSWMPSLRLHRLKAIIDDTSGSRLINLWRHVQECTNTKKIELAFKRWSETSERLLDEDKLIDYWVALESLFTSDSNQEVKFRASLRIAAFLGETPENRKDIYNDMRNSYDRRSAIVHGEFRKPKKVKELNKKYTLHEITEKTHSYLRASILRLLESNEGFDPTGIEMRLLCK